MRTVNRFDESKNMIWEERQAAAKAEQETV